MKFIKGFFLFFSLLFSLSKSTSAQIKFYAEATPQNVTKDGYINYELTIENGKGEASIQPPSFAGFKIMGPPTEGKRKNTVVNGSNISIVQTITLSYTLQPKANGTYSIGTATANVDGVLFKSNTVKIDVTNDGINNMQSNTPSIFDDLNNIEPPNFNQQFNDHLIKQGESIAEKVSKNMQFNLQLSKNTCYVGEPIMASYKLFTRLPTESNLEKFPSFNGVSVIDNTDNFGLSNFSQEKISGKLFNVYTICKAQLYPLQAGIINIESATLNNKVKFLKYDNTGNENLIEESINLISKPQPLNVLPLPSNNKPINFSGSVGSFAIDANLEKNLFDTNEAGKLIINITGNGNMQLLTLPTIQWPQEIEAFEQKTTDNIISNTMPISGSKTFEIPFAVNRQGKFILPKIEFTFFNPSTKSYETVFSKEINFEVKKGNGFFKKPTVNSVKNNTAWLTIRKIIPTVILLSIFGFIYYLFFQNKKKKNITKKPIEVEVKPRFIFTDKNYLENSKQIVNEKNNSDFFITLKNEFFYFLSKRYIVDKEMIKVNTIEALLHEFNVNNALIIETKNFLQKLEIELYKPFDEGNDLILYYDKAQQLIQQHILEKN